MPDFKKSFNEPEYAIPEQKDTSAMTEEELDAYIKELRSALALRLKILEQKKKFFSDLAERERYEAEQAAMESEIDKLEALRKALELS